MNKFIPPSGHPPSHTDLHSSVDMNNHSVTKPSHIDPKTNAKNTAKDQMSSEDRIKAQLQINDTTRQLLKKHFSSVNNQQFIHELLGFFAKTTPFIIKVHRTRTLVHPLQGYAISEDLPKILEYLSLTKSYNLLYNVLKVTEINEQEAEQYLQGLKKLGGRQISISAMLWQVFQTVLNEDVAYDGHQLSLKLKFMPNLSHLGDIDTSIGLVFATCLSMPKTIDQLKYFFPNISENRLNTILFLSILSQMADFSVINSQVTSKTATQSSTAKVHHQVIEPDANSDKQLNTDVSRAKKTGFFKRLLNKLSW